MLGFNYNGNSIYVILLTHNLLGYTKGTECSCVVLQIPDASVVLYILCIR